MSLHYAMVLVWLTMIIRTIHTGKNIHIVLFLSQLKKLKLEENFLLNCIGWRKCGPLYSIKAGVWAWAGYSQNLTSPFHTAGYKKHEFWDRELVISTDWSKELHDEAFYHSRHHGCSGTECPNYENKGWRYLSILKINNSYRVLNWKGPKVIN